MTNRSRVSYDELWRSAWGDMQKYGPVHRHIQEDVVRTLAALPIKTVVEVGCGSGENLRALAATGRYELTGVDVSAEALELASTNVPGATMMLLDAQRERLPQQFDAVISIQVVEHLLDDVAALRNMANMSRRYVYISTISGRMRRSELAIGHIRNYSDIELRAKLEHAGLEVLDIHGWGWPFYTPLYRTAVELLPGGAPTGPTGFASRLAARALYQLYRLNVPGKGDVISALAVKAQD